jgi:hypothetical protein
MVFDGFLHEFVDLFGDLLSCIEQRLLLVVLPVQGQI